MLKHKKLLKKSQKYKKISLLLKKVLNFCLAAPDYSISLYSHSTKSGHCLMTLWLPFFVKKVSNKKLQEFFIYKKNIMQK